MPPAVVVPYSRSSSVGIEYKALAIHLSALHGDAHSEHVMYWPVHLHALAQALQKCPSDPFNGGDLPLTCFFSALLKTYMAGISHERNGLSLPLVRVD